jgi:hypothetical protein
MPEHPVVPKLWPESTVVCIGTGASLTREDVERCHRPDVHVIAVNDAYKMAPWADVLYACDCKWWLWHKGAPTFAGLKYSLEKNAARFGVTVLRQAGLNGLEPKPDGLRTGKSSGYQAVNLAVHLGARKIVLLGYDYRGLTHYFGSHPDGSHPPHMVCLKHFATLVEPLAQLGIVVINATRHTDLKVFPCQPIEEALA